MKAIVTASARFETCNNEGWVGNAALGYSFWKRYLAIFESVILFVRARKVESPSKGTTLVTGNSISLIPCGYFEGPFRYLLNYFNVRRCIKNILEENKDAALLFRVPCTIGFAAINVMDRNRPYAVEVVGDPWDMFSPGAVKHFLRPILRLHFARDLRKACRNATAALYVTEEALQRRYPSLGIMVGVSDVELNSEDIVDKPRKSFGKGVKRILFVGTLNQLYKAPDILIRAAGIVLKKGINIELEILGDGQYKNYLENIAVRLGIRDRIKFLGMVTRDEVLERMDSADLFILPSRQEGLPKAMLEAMARGLPCIGTSVGGIPELLPPEDMVPPGKAKALAAKIIEVLSDIERMTAMSQRNLTTALEYREEILQEKREAFYKLVREKTEEWAKKNEAGRF